MNDENLESIRLVVRNAIDEEKIKIAVHNAIKRELIPQLERFATELDAFGERANVVETHILDRMDRVVCDARPLVHSFLPVMFHPGPSFTEGNNRAGVVTMTGIKKHRSYNLDQS